MTTPKSVAISDMRACGLDVTVLRRIRIVTEIDEVIRVQDGRILNGGRRVKRTIIQEIQQQ